MGRRDLASAAGCLLIFVGTALVFLPAALILLGVLILAAAIEAERRAALTKSKERH